MLTIKKCPHCGGTPRLHTTGASRDGPGQCSVRCDDCGAQGGTPKGELMWRGSLAGMSEAEAISAHEAEAVRLWNQRV